VRKTLFITAALCALVACSSTKSSTNSLATTRVALDRDQYTLRRVGILPVNGEGMRAEEERAFQGALATELSSRWPAEIIPLREEDAAETPRQDGFHTGRIDPAAIVLLAKRYNLDGVVAVTITERRAYPPQRLGIEVELTACDTGLPIWAASLHMDAAGERTRSALHAWFESKRSKELPAEAWDLCLLSPQRFAEFAAAQVAMAW
jgi:hypothetical protein